MLHTSISGAHTSIRTVRILIVHNFYRNRGGEDIAVISEVELLRQRGHDVRIYSRNSDDLARQSSLLVGAAGAIWNKRTIRDIEALLKSWRPDIAHVHNFFPLVSVAIFHCLKRMNIPLVHTLHNFRLICLAGTLSRDGKPCELCLGGSRAPGLLRSCYRGSLPASVVASAALGFGQKRGTWWRKVDNFFALSEFARAKFIEAGLPGDRIRVKANFLYPDPGGRTESGQFGLYAGRLSSEKGILTLTTAAAIAQRVPLKIVGEGPLFEIVKDRLDRADCPAELLGPVSRADVIELMKQAAFVVMPSECYENCPLVLVESMACGVPVIASRIGSLEELVIDRVNGLHFRAGDVDDLAKTLLWAWESPSTMQALGLNARRMFEEKYSADAVYHQLLQTYTELVEREVVP